MFYINYIPFIIDEAEFYGPEYIQFCEYFQLDPRINYTFEQLNKRYEEIMNKFKNNPGQLTLKNLNEINKSFLKIKKWKNKLPLIVNYTTKLILQKILIIPDGMIQEKFLTSKGLTKEAIKPYYRYISGNLLILLIVFLFLLGFIFYLYQQYL